jgi:methylenetetrahydrofolate dehydrogenase (NADP+)/methenyltetrahydrofolate cyclohydrolase
MSAHIINGKEIAQIIKDELKVEVEGLVAKGIIPTLAVVLVGEDPASKVYVKNKKIACTYVGIRSLSYELPSTASQDEVLAVVDELNKREDVHGILVQLPLPTHINDDLVIMALDPKKDVDGFHPINVGNLSIGHDGFVSCTPAGIIELLKRSDIPISGQNCVIIGRSNIVGKPISMLLLRESGTVTITHSRTKNLAEVCKGADILIVAIGRAKFVTKEFVKEGATVIDVGINRDENGKLCGDVDFDDCIEIAGAITPVPKGVGPMTIAMLMNNCVKAVNRN